MSSDRKRVVITGMGVKTPAGNDLDTFWNTIRATMSVELPAVKEMISRTGLAG